MSTVEKGSFTAQSDQNYLYPYDIFESSHWFYKPATNFQIRLRFCVVWSGPSFPAYFIKSFLRNIYKKLQPVIYT